jgi:17beta-estradiol 17-dehydrogenase / very-long-chain 3-oxoacyl-CoA reductase
MEVVQHLLARLAPLQSEFLRLSLSFKIVALLGAFVLLRLVLGTGSFLRRNFLNFQSKISASELGAFKGSYAVVTGATDGIGKEYAMQLAGRGFNLLLISRNQERLNQTASEISAKYAGRKFQPQVQTMAIDLGQVPDNFAQRVAALNIQITVLVNNVGMSYEMPTPFEALSVSFIRDLINLNIRAATEVTHAIVPLMIARKRGVILTVSSGSSLHPAPLLSVYGASKAYLNSWSESLGIELARHRIYVECQVPHYIVSKLSKIRRASLAIPTPSQYVRVSLARLGNGPITSPWIYHQFVNLLLDSVPCWLRNKIIYGELASVRKRALAKAARESTTAKQD